MKKKKLSGKLTLKPNQVSKGGAINGVWYSTKDVPILIYRNSLLKPKKIKSGFYTHICPSCNFEIIVKKQNYCLSCGQKLNWNKKELTK